MSDQRSDLVRRFTSRKLWFAISAFAALMAVKRYTEAVALAGAYIGVEGAIDLKSR